MKVVKNTNWGGIGVAAGDGPEDGLYPQCRYLRSLSLTMIAVLWVTQMAPSRVLAATAGFLGLFVLFERIYILPKRKYSVVYSLCDYYNICISPALSLPHNHALWHSFPTSPIARKYTKTLSNTVQYITNAVQSLKTTLLNINILRKNPKISRFSQDSHLSRTSQMFPL